MAAARCDSEETLWFTERAAMVVRILGVHQRNAKLQLTVLLAPPEPVPGLYLHPDHRRRRSRPPLRTEFDV
jgi:hypothetical protein